VALQRLIGIDAWRLRSFLPCLLVFAASLFLIAPATAAPLVGTAAPTSQPTREPVCLAAAISLCDAGFAAQPVVPVEFDGAFVVRIGTSLWNGTALGNGVGVSPIPLPAAGWLVLAGMGALGLMRRRSSALSGRPGVEPLGTALRGSALRHAPGTPARPSFLIPQALRRAARSRLRRNWQARAFSPGTCSPVRHCGGAGHRYAATAERAPPWSGACSTLSGPHASAPPTVCTDPPSMMARIPAGRSAAFPLPADLRPAAPGGTGAGRPVTTARTGRTRTQSRRRPEGAAVSAVPSDRRPGYGRDRRSRRGCFLQLEPEWGTIMTSLTRLTALTTAAMLMAGTASASPIFIGNMAGNWENAVGGTNVNTNGGFPPGLTATINWGTSTGSGQSGYTFVGNSPSGGWSEGQNIDLGTFTHINQPIGQGTAISFVNLVLSFDVEVPQGNVVSNETLTFDFDHFETPNVTNCPNPLSVSDCDDEVSVSFFSGTDSFQIGNLIYEFTVQGFQQGGNPIVNPLLTLEGGNTTANLIATYTTTVVPLPAAAWLLLAGIGGLGLASRRRKADA
jgi:hypothetical protein